MTARSEDATTPSDVDSSGSSCAPCSPATTPESLHRRRSLESICSEDAPFWVSNIATSAHDNVNAAQTVAVDTHTAPGLHLRTGSVSSASSNSNSDAGEHILLPRPRQDRFQPSPFAPEFCPPRQTASPDLTFPLQKQDGPFPQAGLHLGHYQLADEILKLQVSPLGPSPGASYSPVQRAPSSLGQHANTPYARTPMSSFSPVNVNVNMYDQQQSPLSPLKSSLAPLARPWSPSPLRNEQRPGSVATSSTVTPGPARQQQQQLDPTWLLQQAVYHNRVKEQQLKNWQQTQSQLAQVASRLHAARRQRSDSDGSVSSVGSSVSMYDLPLNDVPRSPASRAEVRQVAVQAATLGHARRNSASSNKSSASGSGSVAGSGSPGGQSRGHSHTHSNHHHASHPHPHAHTPTHPSAHVDYASANLRYSGMPLPTAPLQAQTQLSNVGLYISGAGLPGAGLLPMDDVSPNVEPYLSLLELQHHLVHDPAMSETVMRLAAQARMAQAQNEAQAQVAASQGVGGPSATNRKLGLYKTELCRSWEEKGSCRYGTKCQFAHGQDELRVLDRHPKYKTEVCRTFWINGSCPYGRRCCFLHNTIPSSLPLSTTPAFAIVGDGADVVQEPTSRIHQRMASKRSLYDDQREQRELREPRFGSSINHPRGRSDSAGSNGSNASRTSSRHILGDLATSGLRISLAPSTFAFGGGAPQMQSQPLDPWANPLLHQPQQRTQPDWSTPFNDRHRLDSPASNMSPAPGLSPSDRLVKTPGSSVFSPLTPNTLHSPWTPMTPAVDRDRDCRQPVHHTSSVPSFSFISAPIGPAQSVNVNANTNTTEPLARPKKFLEALIDDGEDEIVSSKRFVK